MTMGRAGLRAGMGMSPYRPGTKATLSDVLTHFSGRDGYLYDARVRSSLKQLSDGTVAVNALNDPVGYIADLTSGGRNLTNPTLNQRALLSNIDGHDSLFFDGVDDVLWHQVSAGVGSFNRTADGLVMLAGRRESQNGSMMAGDYLSNVRYWRFVNVTTSNRINGAIRGPGGNFQPTVAAQSAPISQYGISILTGSATLATTYSPNGSVATAAITGDTVNPLSRISLGGMPAGAAAIQQYWTGLAGFVGAVTPDDIAILRSYFA